MESSGGIKERLPKSELAKLTDPNFIVEIAVGPPQASLVPQTPGTGIVVGGRYCEQETRFVWKKAHFSFDDNRIFDAQGRLMANAYHYGKNPYASLDPLGVMNLPTNPAGEWESVCYISGYQGMPDLKVRPKSFSLHGRQYILDAAGEATLCNIAKQSRLKSMSIRSNLAVFKGDEEHDPTYLILVDLVGRTIQVVNDKEERVAVFTKSEKTLLLNAAFGIGSEFAIDVAPGVDWTAILAICIGLHQVGKSYAKDAFSNFLVQPLQNEAQNFAVSEGQAVFEGVVNGDGSAYVEAAENGDGAAYVEGVVDGAASNVEGIIDGNGEASWFQDIIGGNEGGSSSSSDAGDGGDGDEEGVVGAVMDMFLSAFEE